MTQHFDDIIERRGSGSLKWDAYRDRDVIPMWVADMDFASPPAVVDALRERLDHGIFGYALPPDELVSVLESRFKERYGWPIEPDWLVWLPGVVPGLVAACQAFSEPGDEVVTFTPVYPPFLGIPEHVGRRLVTVGLVLEDGRYRIDIDAFQRALTPHTRLLLLCQPHNPVGCVFSEQELGPLLALCHARGIIVCSDEIHCDLILDGRRHRPVPSLHPRAPEMTITLMSPGKTFNTAGLNLGFAVVPNPELRQRLSQARRYALPSPNLLGFAAALAAYRDGESWRQELLTVLRRNAETVWHTVNERIPGISMNRVEATYLAWLDVRPVDHCNPLALFQDHGVALSDGTPFGSPGFLRLNFGCPMPLLVEGLRRVAAAAQSCRTSPT